MHCCPDLNQLMTYLKEVRPQLLFGVPRVFEKIYAGVNAALAADPDKQKQFDDGVALAIEIKRAELAGIDTDEQRDTWAFLDAVAFSTVRVTGRARRARVRDHRRRADPRRDPGVVRRHRCPAVGDLRHVRVERADDVLAASATSPGSSANRSLAARWRSPTTVK